MSSLAPTLRSTWDNHASKFLRYSGAAVFNIALGQSLLRLFDARYPGWLANVLAVLISSAPAFYLNKRFVWKRTGRANVRSEMLPFFAMNLAGLLLSTGAVFIAERIWGSGVAVHGASLAAWGALWVLKYALLDRVLFNDPEPAVPVG